jgi:hypothetical protein
VNQRKTALTQKGYLKNSTLILFAFSTAFFARIFCSVTRAPSALIHVHFFTIFFVFIVAIATAKTSTRKQIQISWSLIYALLFLLAVMIASALLNDVGVINAIFHFLMLGEPFIFLLAIVCIPMSLNSVKRFKNWIIVSSFINMALAFIQWPLLKNKLIFASGLDETDGIGGVFFVSGAGNYVSATVSVFFGLYCLFYVKAIPILLRISILLAALFQVKLSDSKQVMMVLFTAWVLLILTNLKNLRKVLLYSILIIIISSAFYWCIYNVEAFSAFRNYADKEGVYGPDGEGQIKFAAFNIIPTYYKSWLNWWLGLGSGHTVGRLGGWLLEENWAIFGPLGATRHLASDAVKRAYYNSWIAMESTMFCPMFGWAGIWGDLGYVGLGAYLYLWFIVWHNLCVNNLSKFFVLCVIIFGSIFTQMEEPGFMIYTIALIGLQWQEQQVFNTKSDY